MAGWETHVGPPPGADPAPSLLGSVWRFWWLVATAMIVGALAGTVFAALRSPAFQATAQVLVSSQSGPPVAASDAVRNVANQAAVMRSAAVLSNAAERLGDGLTVEQLRAEVTITPSTTVDLVTIRGSARSPERASQLTDAVVDAYTDVLARAKEAEITTATEQIKARESALQAALAQAQDGLRRDAGNPVLSIETDAIKAQLLALATQRLQIATSSAPSPALTGLLNRAEASTTPAGPPSRRLTAVGGLGGLVVGAVLAWWLAGLRRNEPPPWSSSLLDPRDGLGDEEPSPPGGSWMAGFP